MNVEYCTGLLEPSALTAVRTALQQRMLTAEVQTVRAHFQAAFAEEHQGLLAEIEHMHSVGHTFCCIKGIDLAVIKTCCTGASIIHLCTLC